MTYRSTINISPTDFYGNRETTITTESFDTDKFVSENDLVEGGATVETKDGRSRTITDEADLQDTDRIVVMGVPMTVAQARSMGFSAELKKVVAASAADFQRVALEGKAPVQEEPSQEETQAEAFHEKVEQGLTSYEESNAFETGAGALEMHTGMNPNQTAELVTAVLSGDVSDQHEVWSDLQRYGVSRGAAQQMIGNAQKIGEDIARRELGPDRYNELNGWASESRTIRDLVIKHGLKRARGQAEVGWDAIHAAAKQLRSR